MRRIIANTLRKIGFLDLEEADNGAVAFNKVQSGGVEFLLTDWNMPVMDGLELVTKVRQIDKAIPILMITTNASKDDIIQALQAGVSSYIVKPFSPETLKDKIESLLG
jgi:two-component system chemotaxis response regulator CheY